MDGDCAASRSGRFATWERIRVTHWVEGSMGTRAGLHVSERKKSLTPVIETPDRAVRRLVTVVTELFWLW